MFDAGPNKHDILPGLSISRKSQQSLLDWRGDTVYTSMSLWVSWVLRKMNNMKQVISRVAEPSPFRFYFLDTCKSAVVGGVH